MGKTNEQVAQAFLAGEEAENHRRTFYSKRHDPEDFNPYAWRVGEKDTLYGKDNEGLIELWSYDMRIAIRFDSLYAFGPFDLIGDVKKFPTIARPEPNRLLEWNEWMEELNQTREEGEALTYRNTPFILAVSRETAGYTRSTTTHWEALERAAYRHALVQTCDFVTDAEHREQCVRGGAVYKRAVPGPRGGKGRPQFLYSEYRIQTWTTHRGEVNLNDVGMGWRARS